MNQRSRTRLRTNAAAIAPAIALAAISPQLLQASEGLDCTASDHKLEIHAAFYESDAQDNRFAVTYDHHPITKTTARRHKFAKGEFILEVAGKGGIIVISIQSHEIKDGPTGENLIRVREGFVIDHGKKIDLRGLVLSCWVG